jgi:hypothetical protein
MNLSTSSMGSITGDARDVNFEVAHVIAQVRIFTVGAIQPAP